MKAAKFLFLFLVNAEANNLEKLFSSKQGFVFEEIKLEELHETAGTGSGTRVREHSWCLKAEVKKGSPSRLPSD